MNKLCLALGWVVSALLAGCGGQNHTPPAPTAAFSGQWPTLPDPEPEVTALNGQLWTSTQPGGPQRHIVVNDDLGFMGWWMEQPDAGPPVYGVFYGGLAPHAGTDRFDTTDMVSLQLPPYQVQLGDSFAMTSPQAGETQVAFNSPTTTETMRAEASARVGLSMQARSGRYAGELQLPGRREPVSLQWDAVSDTQGTITLSLTNLPGNNCSATGQASPLAGAPARLLAFTLAFSGAGCPDVVIAGPSTINLGTVTISGAIDASSADAFVLFGATDSRLPLLLPATRVPPVALQGAWTGAINGTQIGLRVAVLDDWSVLGWFNDPTRPDQAHGLLLGSLQPPAPGDTSFGGAPLLNWVPLTFGANPSSIPGFSGPLPVSEVMSGQLGGPATVHAVPIAQQALPMAVRSGQYAGNLQLPQLSVPARLTWNADGSIHLSMSGWPSCAADGQTEALQGGPARWLSVSLVFSGAGCPSVNGNQNLAQVAIHGAVDASSGDAFVLFGLDDNRQVPLVMPATRMP